IHCLSNFLFFSFSHLLFLPLFFFIATATTEIYTLSLHDALPICLGSEPRQFARFLVFEYKTRNRGLRPGSRGPHAAFGSAGEARSEEHTSELQSRFDLVCRLLLEKKKKKKKTN